MTLRLGILGAGNISGTHMAAASEVGGVEVAAVCGEDPARVAEMAEPHGAGAYREVERFFQHRGLDVVLIGTPTGLHADHVVEAARRGLHVLVEKPLDVTTDSADRAIEACQRAGTTLGVIYQERTAPELVWLKQALVNGVLGDVSLASGRLRWFREREYYSESRWRGEPHLAGGGALINQGTHTVDMLLWLLGDVERVFASARTAYHRTNVEDTVVATLEFTSGAIATFEASTAAYPGYPRQIEISGSNGSVIIQGDNIDRLDLREPPAEPPPRATRDDSPRASSPLISDTSGHRRVLQDFLDAVRTGRQPLCDGKEGRRSVAVVEAMYRSARTGAATEPR